MSNYSDNEKAINEFRKQLREMLEDVRDADKKVLNRAMNEGVAFAKRKSPVITGFYRKNWHKLPTQKSSEGIQAELVNNATYAPFVNYGHRIVDKNGNTIGYARSKHGDHLLERTVGYTERRMAELFEKEIKRIDDKHKN